MDDIIHFLAISLFLLVKSCEIPVFFGGEITVLIPLNPIQVADFSVQSPRARPAGKGTNWNQLKNLRWKLKMSHFYQFVDESPKRSHFHCQLTQEN